MTDSELHQQYTALLNQLNLTQNNSLATRLLLASNAEYSTKAFIKKKNGRLKVTRHDVNRALMLLAIYRMGVDISKLTVDSNGVFTNLLELTNPIVDIVTCVKGLDAKLNP